jgi:uncharacterized protein YqjF (DUF2071 family)
MRLTEEGGRIIYTSRRRWPAGKVLATGGTVIVRPGAAVRPDEVTELEHFLTARWRAFADVGRGSIRCTDAEHAPWQLRRVEVERLDDSFVVAAGLPSPSGPPPAHYADRVDVILGLPRRVRPR